MQFPTLLATLLLFTVTTNIDGYDYQQTVLQQNNRPSSVYGHHSPPLSPPVSAPCTEHISASAATQVPVLTAVVRKLEPSGRNYEVKLSHSSHLNLIHAQPPQHAAISGPPTYYTNNHQPINTNGRYSPPMIPSQPRPHQQVFHDVSNQQGIHSAAGSHVSYTAQQNPLLAPQYIQRSPPTSLTPPPPQPQSFSHHINQQQQQPFAGASLGNLQQQRPFAGASLGNQQQQQPFAGASLGNQQQQRPFAEVPLGNQQQQQPFAGASLGNQQQQHPFAGVPLGPTQSNSVGIGDIAPNSQFSSATQSDSASAIDGSIQGVPGNYNSQSEVGQLDHYFEKQNPVGDTRAFTRLISTCYPDGHCEQQQLGSGQVDQRHQHLVLMARARIQPISDKCRALSSAGAMAPISVGSVSVGSASQNSMKRPPNRRRYPYTEVVIPRDPFN